MRVVRHALVCIALMLISRYFFDTQFRLSEAFHIALEGKSPCISPVHSVWGGQGFTACVQDNAIKVRTYLIGHPLCGFMGPSKEFMSSQL